MSYVTHEEEIEGFTIKIIQDENSDDFNDPVKNWDLVGRQVYWHRRYILGHEQPKYSPEEWLENEIGIDELYESWEKIKSHNKSYLSYLWNKFEKRNLIIPVYAYEHGGITIRANSKGAGWDSFDSGQLGFVYASHEKILEEFGGKRITKNVLERAEKCLIQEVETYNDYLIGNVWGYTIEDENGDELDSCWGFIGDWKECLEDAKLNLQYYIKEREKDMKLLDKRMVGEPV